MFLTTWPNVSKDGPTFPIPYLKMWTTISTCIIAFTIGSMVAFSSIDAFDHNMFLVGISFVIETPPWIHSFLIVGSDGFSLRSWFMFQLIWGIRTYDHVPKHNWNHVLPKVVEWAHHQHLTTDQLWCPLPFYIDIVHIYI